MKNAELFDLLLARPALYLGYASVVRAKAFLDGNSFANKENVDSMYLGFNEWVAARFHITTTHDWSSIIAFIGMSESNAFELAKELWEEYKNDVGVGEVE